MLTVFIMMNLYNSGNLIITSDLNYISLNFQIKKYNRYSGNLSRGP